MVSITREGTELVSRVHMSRRTAIIEEFDDDTELPLPALPSTGRTGPLLEEISSSESEDDIRAGPASRPTNTVTDITPYKNWTCIYPIYIDAKRPYGTGERRVARQKSVWWPLSKDIADASNRLGFGTLHEVGKTHPRDWENPGRVRVLWKKDGRLMNPRIKTSKSCFYFLGGLLTLFLQRNNCSSRYVCRFNISNQKTYPDHRMLLLLHNPPVVLLRPVSHNLQTKAKRPPPQNQKCPLCPHIHPV